MITPMISKKEQKILDYLHDNGATSITDLRKAVRVTHELISNLMRHGLLYNFYTENSFEEKYCHYELSKIGKRLF